MMSMHGFCRILLFAVLSIAPLVGLSRAAEDSPGRGKDLPTVKLSLGTATVTAVVANTERSRISGLLGWSSISDREGMLLDFGGGGTYAIHMQGMKFPIDVVWIDSADEITLIYHSIQPNSGLVYSSLVPAAFCLELKAGFCKRFGVKEGQRVRFGASSSGRDKKSNGAK